MYAGIHIKSHFRPILDKNEICRQIEVKISNVRQHFQESRWNSTYSMQKNRQADGHDKTNSRFSKLLAKTPKMKD
jgi:hypothetical protein